jgi:hypothetical protein
VNAAGLSQATRAGQGKEKAVVSSGTTAFGSGADALRKQRR